MALATLAASTVALVGGDVAEAEAAFGEIPPPATSTLCETVRPDQDLVGRATVPVTVGVSSRDGDATSATFGVDTPYAGDFTYSVVLDTTGDPFDPVIDNHPSYHPMSSYAAPVVTGGGTGSSITVDLPVGCRYLMSVRAPGHDLGGSWIRIEDDGTVMANDVAMVTNDRLPLAQVVVRAFHDYAQVNAQFDIGEPGLEGFDVLLLDGGDRVVDYFNNPLCTNYVLGADGVLTEADLDANGMPTIDAANPGGNCLTDAEGFLTIQYIPAGKYGLVIQPPDGTDWVQTTTIEGTHVIDAWLEPGDSGIGGEFIGDINAGTFQAVGFVSNTIKPDPTTNTYHYPYAPVADGGDITGCFFNGQLYPTADGVKTIVQNGIDNPDGLAEPLFDSYVALNDVGVHDTMMALAPTDANGCFRFDDVPTGTYQLAVWDYELLYIIGFYNVTVNPTTVVAGPGDQGIPNGVVDMGDMFVLRWLGWSSGHVFYDSGITRGGNVIDTIGDSPEDFASDGPKDASTKTAANGVRDCIGQNELGFDYDTVDPDLCEPGIPEQPITIRNRDGQVWTGAVSDANGYYEVNVWSPLFRMQTIEVGVGALDLTGHSTHDQFDHNKVASQSNCPANIADILADPTLGVVPADCQPTELGGGVILASIFQQGKRNTIDFGKLSYLDPSAPNGYFTGGTVNGGIAGAVFNTVTRAEWGASDQVADANEPGVPGTTVTLYELDPACTLVDPVTGASGADNGDCYTIMVDSVVTDSYQHPTLTGNGQDCPIPTVGGGSFSAINPNFKRVEENCNGAWLLGSHTKDGAYDGGFAFTGLQSGFYVVDITPPPGYQFVKESDLNTGEGNSYVPAKPAGGCVGEYHYAQVGDEYVSPYDAFDDATGTYNGADPVRLCNRRLVRVQPLRNTGVDVMLQSDGMDRTWQTNFTGIDGDPGTPGYQQSTAPVDPYTIADQAWHSTETVPAPGHLFGLVLNDLNMTANQNSLTFGEQQGVAGVPVGVYDHTGGYITTVWTDENGQYEMLLPSEVTINRAAPGGVGPQMYTFIVNDPGPTGKTWGYDKGFITNPNILEVNSGIMTKADTPLLSLAAGPCTLPLGTPQLFEADAVYGTTGSLPTATYSGVNLAGTTVLFVPQNTDGTLNKGAAVDVTPHVTFTTGIPTPDDPNTFYDTAAVDLAAAESALGAMSGPYQVMFDDGTRVGSTPRNTITFHVLSPAYDLQVFTARTPVTETDFVIQEAVNAADAATGDALVVIPAGTYRESVVVPSGMVIQGHGSGGIIGVPEEFGPIGQVETPYAFLTGTVVSPFGALLDNRMYDAFEATIAGMTWDGNQGVEVGPAFQFLLTAGEVASNDPFQLDGMGITSVRAQNGSVHVNGHADGLVLSNLGMEANNGSEGGADINLGTHSSVTFVNDPAGSHARINGRVQPVAAGQGTMSPLSGTFSDASNDGVVIRNNRLTQSGSNTLAGAVGIFNGNDGYQVLDNEVCGNYSAEYGGGLSHNGVSDGGIIAGNVFQNNESFDEGGAIFIGGEVGWPNAGDLGAGIGSLTLDSNHILYNLSGDDGGGIMVLNTLDSPIRMSNNVIGQNVATDLGGGVHLATAGAVTFVHNTVVGNMSTNSSEDSGGFSCNGDVNVPADTGTNTCPRAGGLTSQPHSPQFTPADGSTFSDPLLQNNIFWNNKAGYVVAGQNQAPGNIVQVFGTADLGVYLGAVDQAPAMQLNPEYSVLSVPYGLSGTNEAGQDPLFTQEQLLEIQSQAAPALGAAAQIDMVYPATSPIEAGDYHLTSGASPAADLGLIGLEGFDFDGEARPFTGPLGNNTAPDAGADEFGAATITGLMFFSTVRANDNGIMDEDVQAWTAGGFETVLDGSAIDLGLEAGAADIDGLHVLTPTSFLISFLGNNVSVGGLTVNDEDIVRYDSDTDQWSMVLDGSAVGLTGGARDIDALHQMADGSYLVSFAGFAALPTAAGPDTLGVPDEDIVRMIPVTSNGAGAIVEAIFEPWFSGATLGLDGSGAGDVDGVALVGNTLLLSTRGRIQVGDLDVRDEDVIACGGLVQNAVGLWECDQGDFLFFDGSAEGLAGNNDVNAVSGPLAN